MNEHPHQPGVEPAHSNATSLQHGKILAHDCHVSLVEVSEGTPRDLAFELTGNHLADVAPLLDRNLGNTGQWPSALIQGSDVADGENASWARHRQEPIDRNAT